MNDSSDMYKAEKHLDLVWLGVATFNINKMLSSRNKQKHYVCVR